jgi:hypothetical protein
LSLDTLITTAYKRKLKVRGRRSKRGWEQREAEIEKSFHCCFLGCRDPCSCLSF